MKPQSLTEEGFRNLLLDWHSKNSRRLPWKDNKDPYLIWLSEIILQQTRVDQGLSYFLRFREQYPTIHDLAGASRDEVMKNWEGLGYYSRARNLHDTARYISGELKGEFPRTYREILSLKGVGPYTAAAIASFAFDLPHAVVDGNVFRVLARIFGIDTPIDSTAGKKYFGNLATRLLDHDAPGDYNQAIMDFGATHCVPRKPLCQECPFRPFCSGFNEKKVEQLPVKGKKLDRRERFFHYLLLQCKNEMVIHRRKGKDIWQQLFQFPLIELPFPARHYEDLKDHPDWEKWVGKNGYEVIQVSKPFQQILTHQRINAKFWTIEVETLPDGEENQFIKTKRENLSKFAFPKIIDWYLRDKSLYLNLH